MTDTQIRSADASFIIAVIRDNERWNSKGITEPDIAVCFEMAGICDWGASYTKSRFNEALRVVKATSPGCGVLKQGDRWYDTKSLGLERIGDQGKRQCARPKCTVDIGHLRADAAYCGPRCRQLDWKRVQMMDRPSE